MRDARLRRRGRAAPAAGLLALLLLTACRDGAPPPPAGLDVTRYDVALTLDPATLRLEGTARLRVLHPGLNTLPLRLDGPKARSVTVDGAPADFRQRGATLSVPVAGDSSEVVVVYAGVPAAGVYAEEAAGQRVVWTDGWPQRTAGWLPGIHHPSDPARLTLSLTVPAGWEVAASGVPAGEDGTPGGTRYRFRLDTPAPVYTFAWAVADFAVAETAWAGRPVRHYLLEADSARVRGLARTPRALAYFDSLLGPYAYAAYATVQVPHAFAGMENAAAPFLAADLYDRPALLEEVQVHEAAHQWFGNRVVPADWRDLWLAEGAATYLEALFFGAVDGPDAFRRRMVAAAALSSLDRRSLAPLRPARLSEPFDALGWVPYRRGACALHALRLRLGDDAFFGALRAVYAAHGGGPPLSSDAFRRALETTSGQDLERFFEFWVHGADVPALRWRWDAAARRLTWRVEGDAGTLDGLPFELMVRQGAAVAYVDARTGQHTLGGAARPVVAPVGVMLAVEGPGD